MSITINASKDEGTGRGRGGREEEGGMKSNEKLKPYKSKIENGVHKNLN